MNTENDTLMIFFLKIDSSFLLTLLNLLQSNLNLHLMTFIGMLFNETRSIFYMGQTIE
jgi:hypothetical protein